MNSFYRRLWALTDQGAYSFLTGQMTLEKMRQTVNALCAVVGQQQKQIDFLNRQVLVLQTPEKKPILPQTKTTATLR